jgi:hypothetical protein
LVNPQAHLQRKRESTREGGREGWRKTESVSVCEEKACKLSQTVRESGSQTVIQLESDSQKIRKSDS